MYSTPCAPPYCTDSTSTTVLVAGNIAHRWCLSAASLGDRQKKHKRIGSPAEDQQAGSRDGGLRCPSQCTAHALHSSVPSAYPSVSTSAGLAQRTRRLLFALAARNRLTVMLSIGRGEALARVIIAALPHAALGRAREPASPATRWLLPRPGRGWPQTQPQHNLHQSSTARHSLPSWGGVWPLAHSAGSTSWVLPLPAGGQNERPRDSPRTSPTRVERPMCHADVVA